MNLLKAKNILWPEWYKEYNIKQLENFYNYDRLLLKGNRTESQKFRLECLMQDMDEHGLLYPIIVSVGMGIVYRSDINVCGMHIREDIHISLVIMCRINEYGTE
jgi:hypothetical protein